MTLKEQIRANRWRTLWLLLLFGILVAALALILGFAFNRGLLFVVGVGGIVYAIFSWLSAGRMVAAVTGAKPADRAQYPRLYHVLETVAIAAGPDRRSRRRAGPAAAPRTRSRPGGARTPRTWR